MVFEINDNYSGMWFTTCYPEHAFSSHFKIQIFSFYEASIFFIMKLLVSVSMFYKIDAFGSIPFYFYLICLIDNFE